MQDALCGRIRSLERSVMEEDIRTDPQRGKQKENTRTLSGKLVSTSVYMQSWLLVTRLPTTLSGLFSVGQYSGNAVLLRI